MTDIILTGNVERSFRLAAGQKLTVAPGADVTVTGIVTIPAGADGATIDGSPGKLRFLYKGTQSGLVQAHAHNVVLRAFEIDNQGVATQGVNLASGAKGTLLDRLTIHNVGGTGQTIHGIYPADTYRTVVRDCLVYDVRGGYAFHGWQKARDALIEACTFVDVRGGVMIGGSETVVSVIRSIIVGASALYGVDKYNATLLAKSMVKDSLVWSCLPAAFDAGVPHERILSVAPQFVDRAHRDYRLSWGSPAVGYGPSWLQPVDPCAAERAAVSDAETALKDAQAKLTACEGA